MLSCTSSFTATSVYQQRVRGDQKDLEKNEEVKGIGRQEGAIQSHQLEHKQRMEKTPRFILTATRIQVRA